MSNLEDLSASMVEPAPESSRSLLPLNAALTSPRPATPDQTQMSWPPSESPSPELGPSETATPFLSSDSPPPVHPPPPATCPSAITQSTYCPLLELPAELRNEVYHMVLNPNGMRTYIYNGIPEPALILSCKQIREEGRPIYYAKNNFGLRRTDYKSLVYVHASKRSKELYRKYKLHLTFTNYGTRVPNWKDLLEWLARVHGGEISRGTTRVKTTYSHPSAAQNLVATMFSTIKLLKAVPWSQVEKVMEEYHLVLQGMDSRWA